jgi:hypothetical protein
MAVRGDEQGVLASGAPVSTIQDLETRCGWGSYHKAWSTACQGVELTSAARAAGTAPWHRRRVMQ